MTNSLIEIATCTLGPSSRRLDTYLGELRRMTAVPFRQVVVDDGSDDPDGTDLLPFDVGGLD